MQKFILFQRSSAYSSGQTMYFLKSLELVSSLSLQHALQHEKTCTSPARRGPWRGTAGGGGDVEECWVHPCCCSHAVVHPCHGVERACLQHREHLVIPSQTLYKAIKFAKGRLLQAAESQVFLLSKELVRKIMHCPQMQSRARHALKRKTCVSSH